MLELGFRAAIAHWSVHGPVAGELGIRLTLDKTQRFSRKTMIGN